MPQVQQNKERVQQAAEKLDFVSLAAARVRARLSAAADADKANRMNGL
jgi:hypothetical protein